jgi:hypothetical protein
MLNGIKNVIKAQTPGSPSAKRTEYKEKKAVYTQLKSLCRDRSISPSIRQEAKQLRHQIQHDNKIGVNIGGHISANFFALSAAVGTGGIGAIAFVVTIPCAALSKGLYNQGTAASAYAAKDKIDAMQTKANEAKLAQAHH